MGLFPFTQEWAPLETTPFPRELLRAARLKGAVPLLRWEPRSSTFPALTQDSTLRRAALTASPCAFPSPSALPKSMICFNAP